MRNPNPVSPALESAREVLKEAENQMAFVVPILSQSNPHHFSLDDFKRVLRLVQAALTDGAPQTSA